MIYSRLGQLAAHQWLIAVSFRAELLPSVHAVMPDHVHVLFGIRPDYGPETTGGGHGAGNPSANGREDGVAQVVGGYMAAVTSEARRLRLWPKGRLWQGRFEHRVILDAAECALLHGLITSSATRCSEERREDRREAPLRVAAPPRSSRA